ncbi:MULTISPECIES: NAD-dependent epimerase/dehydratase family protein [unclassified Coleofasciculus]|uniref:NAD-dependent epimerase/dehydratase family protein n=1 Tax=unclassified Coleofasciculus TaxID=2692782 RepID=UPI00187F6248|nr:MULTISPECIES: SDR family oxidoreductase [unclassified Coleofasciculus]MBE9126891.1 SDR family oxidoreductase [Coleofasciculus sp. LEGE 07081]MBE9150213.1 SDR family oxidoreductase [Coleofasciculus sp. LEGE 07092]
MKSALILGVTGFIGRYISRHFFEAGWLVVGVGTRPPENAPSQYLITYQQMVLPSTELVELIKDIQPQVCIHCVGRASVGLSVTEPAEDFQASVTITFHLLNTLRLYAPQCRLIYLSSAAVYGNPEILPIKENHKLNPISPYGFHKLMCEQLCIEFFKIYGLPTAVVRIFSAYGPGLRRQVLWDICQKALTQTVLKLQGTGNESRDFIHVRDVAKAIYTLAEKAPCKADVYNLASSVETTIRELAELILVQLECKVSLEFDGKVPLGNPSNWRADMTSFTQFGVTFPEVSLERGVNVYVQWCRAEIIGW